jgi:hypothetical protein
MPGRAAHAGPGALGAPHLDFEMWERTNLNQPVLALSNAWFQNSPGLKIQHPSLVTG